LPPPIRDELRKALIKGIREYGHLAVGVLLIGGPITGYLVIVGLTVTTAVQVIIPFLGMIVSVVLSRRRRRA